MNKIRLLPRKETMIIIYPLVAAKFIIYHYENGLYMPVFILILLTMSMIIFLAMGIKIVIGKLLELKDCINDKRRN